MNRTIEHYSEQASHYYSLYSSVDADNVHKDWKAILQATKPGIALDIGAGSGRDANWLAEKGWLVTAVEPARKLRKLAEQNSHTNITWRNATLPKLKELSACNEQFDLILLSAVWMHLPEKARPEALTRLSAFLSATGRIFISLRFGPNDEKRPMYPVSYDELKTLATQNGLVARNLNPNPTQDTLSRKNVAWITVELKREVQK